MRPTRSLLDPYGIATRPLHTLPPSTQVGAEASWGALLLSSLVAGGLLPDLLAAAAALRHPGARLELAVSLQRLSEQVPLPLSLPLPLPPPCP